jgi:hypothetical protein
MYYINNVGNEEMMKMVYVLLEKSLTTGDVHVVGVYESYDLAEAVMEDHMDLYEEERSYKIVDRTLV